MIPNNMTEWFGLPVKQWKPEDGTPDYANTICRIGFDFEEWDSEKNLANLLVPFFDGEGIEQSSCH